jgi:hypothetical protein
LAAELLLTTGADAQNKFTMKSLYNRWFAFIKIRLIAAERGNWAKMHPGDPEQAVA